MINTIEQELVAIRRSVLSMGASTEIRVKSALEALINHDESLARSVRAGDNEIDEMELSLESECVKLLALQQPVARDLRVVLAVMRINTTLERMADLARSVAKRTIKLAKIPAIEYPDDARAMCDAVKRMVSDAIKAFADNDRSLADRVRSADKYVDERNRELFAWAARQSAADPDNSLAYIHTLVAVRAIERIGDLAANIAEEILFALDGDVVRHQPAASADDTA